MGTRATLSARAGSLEAALRTLDALLVSLERSEDDLSTWRETPFNRLNTVPANVTARVDPASCATLREIEFWTRRTGGAFDPAVGPLIDAWGVQRRGRVPAVTEISAVLAASRFAAWRFDSAACTVARPAGGRLDSGAFGKGEAIDRAARLPFDGRWMIDLGGQVGVPPTSPPEEWRVAIAHPHWRERVVFEVILRRGSLATSGGSERDQHAGATRIGHIIDPRSGRPVSFNGSVVVWHQRGIVADILSTALYVMGPDTGLRWAERNGVAACVLVPEGDQVHVRPTSAFTREFRIAPAQAAAVQPTGVSGIGRL